MQSKDVSILTHILEYCKEIRKELVEIENSKEAYDNSAVYRNSLALCIL